MKNFWLRRHNSRKMHERVNQINSIVQGVINQKINKLKGGGKSWRQKNGIKTQP